MILEQLKDLPSFPEVAVIINAGTREVATLALMSTLRHGHLPVLLIDCDSGDDSSFKWFETLQYHHNFYLMRAPLRKHGRTLDWIFTEITSDSILLVDSDVDLLNSNLLDQMRVAIRPADVFGSGYLHPAQWLQHHYDTNIPLAEGIGYYPARPWIPFTMLKVAPVRQCLVTGHSFMHQLVRNEFISIPALSRILWRRFHFPMFCQWNLDWMSPFRGVYDGHRPAYIHLDTGAEIHAHLIRQGLTFGVVGDAAEVPHSVHHLSGVTRSVLHGESQDAHPTRSAAAWALEKLQKEYGFGGFGGFGGFEGNRL